MELVETLTDWMNTLMNRVDTLINRVDTLIDRIHTLKELVNKLMELVKALIDRMNTLMNRVHTMTNQTYTLINQVYTLIDQVDTLINRGRYSDGRTIRQSEKIRLTDQPCSWTYRSTFFLFCYPKTAIRMFFTADVVEVVEYKHCIERRGGYRDQSADLE